MPARGSQKKDAAKVRQAVAEALLTLRQARKNRTVSAAERIKVARAYRVLGDTARAASWYRSAVDELSGQGEPVKALALAKEMTEVIPQERRTFDDLADRFALTSVRETSLRTKSLRVQAEAETARREFSGKTKVIRPPPDSAETRITRPVVDDKTARSPAPEFILDAAELLKVHEMEELGVPNEPLPRGTFLPSLVPPDVLQELHSRGEIELFDEEGVIIERPGAHEYEIAEIDDDEVEQLDAVLEDDEDLESVERVMDEEELIDSLARVPLFSDLDRKAFAELAREVKLRTINDRAYVFREGDPADSFFLVAEGALEVVRRIPNQKREIVLHQFHQGQAFGIFGLFAGQMRAASCRAIGSAEVIEISAGALAKVVQTHPGARNAISRFYKERLLENFLATSPIFDSLDAVARGLLIGQFKERRLATGEKVVSPGEVFNGLFLVITGELALTKRLGGARDETLAELGKGQFFGVVSALSGTPARCTIAATRESTITFLPQRAFNEFVKDYPALRLLPQRLLQEGMLVEKDIFVGSTGVPGLS